MSKDFALEARIKGLCVDGGVLETALNDFIADYEAFKFAESELPAYIEKCRTEKPHRFAIQSDHDVDLCTAAFVSKNKTAEGRLFREVGPARFADLKSLYANGAPELPGADKKRTSGNNPWSATSWDLRRQLSVVKGLGVAKASELARSANPPSFIGATKPGAINYTSNRRAG